MITCAQVSDGVDVTQFGHPRWSVNLDRQGDGLWQISAWRGGHVGGSGSVGMVDIQDRNLAADVCAALVRLFMAEEG